MSPFMILKIWMKFEKRFFTSTRHTHVNTSSNKLYIFLRLTTIHFKIFDSAVAATKNCETIPMTIAWVQILNFNLEMIMFIRGFDLHHAVVARPDNIHLKKMWRFFFCETYVSKKL